MLLDFLSRTSLAPLRVPVQQDSAPEGMASVPTRVVPIAWPPARRSDLLLALIIFPISAIIE